MKKKEVVEMLLWKLLLLSTRTTIGYRQTEQLCDNAAHGNVKYSALEYMERLKQMIDQTNQKKTLFHNLVGGNITGLGKIPPKGPQ